MLCSLGRLSCGPSICCCCMASPRAALLLGPEPSATLAPACPPCRWGVGLGPGAWAVISLCCSCCPFPSPPAPSGLCTWGVLALLGPCLLTWGPVLVEGCLAACAFAAARAQMPASASPLPPPQYPWVTSPYPSSSSSSLVSSSITGISVSLWPCACAPPGAPAARSSLHAACCCAAASAAGVGNAWLGSQPLLGAPEGDGPACEAMPERLCGAHPCCCMLGGPQGPAGALVDPCGLLRCSWTIKCHWEPRKGWRMAQRAQASGPPIACCAPQIGRQGEDAAKTLNNSC